jgi:uncharacterized protein YndB with AHSA1/START domain
MVRAQAHTLIAIPPDAVFRFVAMGFFENYPRWSPQVVELSAITPGPIRVGTVGRQVRVDRGRRTEARFRVTELVPPRRIAFRGNPPPFHVLYEFEPARNQTRLTFTFELTRLGLLQRPFERLIRVAVREGAEQVVENLRRLLESEAARGAD